MTVVKIDDIKVVNRHRQDLGDLEGLAKSIADTGLLHPVVLTPDLILVAGQRRVSAARSLGWSEIAATVVDNLDDAEAMLRAEQEENTCRKDFTPTEAQALHAARVEVLRPLAEARRNAQLVQNRSGQLPEREMSDWRDRYDETRAVAAEGTGYSEASLRRVRETKIIADDEEAPERIRNIAKESLLEMDETGKIHAPWNRARSAYRGWKGAQEVRDAVMADPEEAAEEPTEKTNSRLDRARQIEDLASRGFTSRQMESKVGVSDKTIRLIARDHAIRIPADEVAGNAKRLDSNRIYREVVIALEGLAQSVVLAKPEDIADRDEAQTWVDSLTESIRALTKAKNKISNQIKESNP